MAKKRAPAQVELPRLRYVRRLWGRKIEVPAWPEDRALDRVEVDGHVLEIWHLSRLDWYEVRIDGFSAHVAGTDVTCAQAWRDNCLEWK